ncbi:23660_t:CDS:2 [Cetraspora pellucida]|uniref:23660_t:CDS:1 n=1 Tax=Cetraspora pellucida TaxID=1433469 RepID=A0A9N9HJR0_9GLOM|nr:23660_t:CDS:2 [Cetraspora pellucida]
MDQYSDCCPLIDCFVVVEQAFVCSKRISSHILLPCSSFSVMLAQLKEVLSVEQLV